MRRFILPAFLVLLFLMLEFTFLSLANWQYRRGKEAEALMHIENPTFTVQGTWVSPTVSIVLDNQPSPENPSASGWRLLTLFHPDEATPTFVDRGWMPFPADRLTANDLPCQSTDLNPTNLQVQQKQYPTRRGMLQGPTTTTDDRIYAFLNPSENLHKNLNRKDYLVTTTPTCEATIALPPPSRNPQRNYSYMLQWLGLALVTPLLFLSLRRRKP